MALIIPGPLITAASGRLGALCFSHQGSSPIVRTQPAPQDRATQLTLTARAQFARCRRAWLALTDAHRLAWRAAAVQFPVTNRIGLTKPLAASALFLQAAMRNLRAGEALPTVPEPSTALLLRPPLAISIWPGGPALLYYSTSSTWSIPATTLGVHRLMRFRDTLPGYIARQITVPASTAPAVDFWSALIAAVGEPAALERLLFDAVSWTPAWPRSLRQRIRVIVADLGPELVTNGSFETGGTPPDAWTLTGSGSLTQDAYLPYLGSYSAYWTVADLAANTQWFTPSAYRWPVTGGATYTISCAYKTDVGGIGAVAWADNAAGETNLGSLPYTGDLDWHTATWTHTPASTTTGGRLIFRSYAHTPCEVFVDHVSVRQVN